MFSTLQEMLGSDLKRAIAIIVALVIIASLIVWVSVIDIRKKSVTFWKMLVTSSSTIIFPLILSFFCGCRYLRYFLIAALILWLFLLCLNVIFNNDKLVGKADFDLLSALFSICIMCSIWLYLIVDPNYVWIKITALWYSLFFYLLIGSLIYLGIYFIITFVRVAQHKTTFRESLRGNKISVIPMFIPVTIMVPYIIMIS